jgi:hypothetical protein
VEKVALPIANFKTENALCSPAHEHMSPLCNRRWQLGSFELRFWKLRWLILTQNHFGEAQGFLITFATIGSATSTQWALWRSKKDASEGIEPTASAAQDASQTDCLTRLRNLKWSRRMRFISAMASGFWKAA